ncbi:hypothetical protein Tco_0484430 [Tanacetum coccineum]
MKTFPSCWPTIEENRVTRTKKYAELSTAEKIQVDCDMKATNIIFQGLPADIYSLVNHQRVAKDLWERVQLLMQVRLLRERNQDPLAFVSNQQMTPSHFNTYQSSYNNPQLQQQFPPSQYGSIHPNQHYSSTYPSQPQFNQSSVPPSYLYQSQLNHQTSSVPQTAYQSPQVSTQPMTKSPHADSGFVVHVFSPGDDLIACFNKAIAFLTAVASLRLQEVIATRYWENNASSRQWLLNATTAQEQGHIARQCTQPSSDQGMQRDPEIEDLDTYDSDCDNISIVKAVLMDNISNYGSDVVSEVPHSETYLNDMENQSVHAMQDFEQTPVVDVTDNEITSDSNIIPKKMIDSQMDDMIKEKLALKEQIDSLEQNLSKQIKENECYQNPFYLKKAQRIKPTLYDGIVMSAKHVAMPVIDDEETLILEEESRSKMSEKEKDPEAIKQNISHKPIDYEKFHPGPVWGCDSLVSRAKVIENQAIAISVISISSDSSEDSTDTPVIPTETPIIAPTIPPSPDYTPASPDYSPASDSESDPSEDPSSDHIPPLPAISPFLSSDDDPTDSDTPDTPSSPTHDTPFTEITASTQRSPIIPRRRVMLLAPGQPIPHGRPSPMTSVPALSPVSGALSPVRADLIPSPKRVRDSGYSTDVEAIEGVQREQGHRIVGVESAVIALTERIAELEGDNKRLRGTTSVESQRVDRLQRGMSRMQRELRQMRRLRFYDRVRVGRLEAYDRKHMGYRP